MYNTLPDERGNTAAVIHSTGLIIVIISPILCMTSAATVDTDIGHPMWWYKIASLSMEYE